MSLLRVSALRVDLGGRAVLRGIDLALERGQWLCLLGPNGSGKTTLLRAITGQIGEGRGIELDGIALSAEPGRAKRAIGFAPPPERLPALLTGRQCLAVYAAIRAQATIDAAVLALAGRVRVDHMLDRPVREYSLGMRQKLAILLALVGAPPLLVLDEAFNGLDLPSAAVLKRALRERVDSGEASVLLATHALDIAAQQATRIALIEDGRIAHDWSGERLRALRTSTDGLEAALIAASA